METKSIHTTESRHRYETKSELKSLDRNFGIPPNPSHEVSKEFSFLLSPAAVQFITKLQRMFGPARERLLARRQEIQSRIDKGEFPDFLRETHDIRESDWRVAPIPDGLQDRKVEITGPPDRKMIIHAMNSGAQVFMADFEDSHSPTWQGTLQGQVNLCDAVRNEIQFLTPLGQELRLQGKCATLFVRPRGWHLLEKHFLVDDRPISASLFDFGLYFFHNASVLVAQGKAPYFYLPKIENHLEARLWNDVFLFAQRVLGLPKGTIRATVLIETVLAAFEMDEILYELRDHSAGLNCGRWDYIFSWIKKFRNHPSFVLPDRAQVTMDAPFLQSYSQLLIKTCHRRGIHAMGGMAAQIPIKADPEANEKAMQKVRSDKLREVRLGHDGTWVAHPGLIGLARSVFDEAIPGANQIQVSHRFPAITAADLLKVPSGSITENGIRTNIQVGLVYLESWLRGVGCLPIHHLMEDAATAEISRAQIWQWIRHGKLTKDFFFRVLSEELHQLKSTLGNEKFDSGKYDLASQLLIQIITSDEFVEFITLPAYFYL